MGFFKNVARGAGRVVVREAKKSVKRTARKAGRALFGAPPRATPTRKRRTRRAR